MHHIQLLKKYELSIKGFRGQHLLIDENIQRKFISLVNPKPDETIIEIGPGEGALTLPLIQKCEKIGCKIMAIEKDVDLAKKLSRSLKKNI